MFAEFCVHEVVGVVYSECEEGYAFNGALMSPLRVGELDVLSKGPPTRPMYEEGLDSRGIWAPKTSWLPPARSPPPSLVGLVADIMDALYGAISTEVVAFRNEFPFATGQQSMGLPSFFSAVRLVLVHAT